ncbi:hypothetical protein CDAR_611381 [Caerostris darwini]|uniref:BACK domain-containing protein n=1 Tax=Caerostris darwini TaxID=1538125 RepID=A0AAV4UQG6_9ARAC|nr:hypothetical protein CDAR_611381 [Caerostris darwini]
MHGIGYSRTPLNKQERCSLQISLGFTAQCILPYAESNLTITLSDVLLYPSHVDEILLRVMHSAEVLDRKVFQYAICWAKCAPHKHFNNISELK